MNIVKRLCRLLAVAGILAVAAGPVTSGNRVNEVCVVAGDIDYCAPKDV
ncbi:MAG TPA: hypothetical protein VJS45_13815 [Acidimicrobiia bacterium]|nr:hypothetical protein [Acidimicrobiia bacterium]